MKRLIVNADDFGLTESVNRGIIAAHRDGILTSASLLANGLAFDDAITLCRQVPKISVGVHLNVSEGTPVSAASRIPTLVSQGGELHLSPFRLAARILTKQIDLQDIRSEFHAQVFKVFDAGITPTHLDGHLHVHILPQLTSLVIALAHEFHIRYVRCPAENLEATLPLLWKLGDAGIRAFERSAIACVVNAFAQALKEPLRTNSLFFTDAFLGLTQTGFLDPKMMRALLDLVPNGTTELMCHPGYTSPQVTSLGGRLTHAREAEVVALTAPEIKAIVEKLGIRLTNFRDLANDVPG